MSFVMRTSCPDGNPYFIRQVNGGYNGAIEGYPTRVGANVLANCVGYANGRFAEIMNEGYIPYQLVCDAKWFIEKAKEYGLSISDKPTLGGIMVWTSPQYGHVEVVERIDNDNQIYTSASNYAGAAFYNATRTNNNGQWGISDAYTFLGCIVNPAVHEDPPQPEPPTPPTPQKFNIGDRVIINGPLYASSDAANPVGNVSNKVTNITRYAAGAPHPYNTTDDLGWMNECDIAIYEEPRKSNEEIADEVIAGLWGDGDERYQRLTEAGYDYNAIQDIVNQKLGVSTNFTVGCSVRVKESAQTYCTGEYIPDWVKGQIYTVIQVGEGFTHPDGVLLDDIMSWVRKDDVTIV